MTRRVPPAVMPLAAAVLLAAAGLLDPPGASLRKTALEYAALAVSDPAAASSLLTDSLSALVRPEAFQAGGVRESAGGPVLGRQDERGFQVLVPEQGGGSRTIWLRRENDRWRVSGDTFLDRILNSAQALCRSYALSIAPAVIAGTPADSFACPVTGLRYGMDSTGCLLVCPAGHLGEGLETGGGACAARRALAASEVASFVAAGHPMPSSFEEMWEAGDGQYGQPGGYRCPDNGYSFYEITDSTVFCPFHQAGTPVAP